MIKAVEQKTDWYQAEFREFEKNLNGESASSIHAIRKEALSRFVELGFPTTQNEEWKYTNIAPIARINFSAIHQADNITNKQIEAFSLGKLKCNRLVFVNGRYAAKLSTVVGLPKSAKIGSLAAALKADDAMLNEHLTRYASFTGDAFTALNTAFLQDGAFVSIPDNVIVNEPIHLLFISTRKDTAFVSHPRNLILVGKSSRASIIESYVHTGSGSYFTNAVTEIVAGENSVVEHDRLQNEGDESFHVSAVHVHQNAHSNYTSNSISLGGLLIRNNITVLLDAEGIECTLNGLSLATAQQHIDNHTTIDHAKPHCNSHELYKCILDGKSRGVFNGKIFVRKDAQKTDAKQTNKTLLLSDDATIDTKPQLEIFADDVKCTHGATVGQLDDEQVFYLRSRGMGLELARNILTSAFAGDVLNRIHVEPFREQLENLIQARLQQKVAK